MRVWKIIIIGELQSCIRSQIDDDDDGDGAEDVLERRGKQNRARERWALFGLLELLEELPTEQGGRIRFWLGFCVRAWMMLRGA